MESKYLVDLDYEKNLINRIHLDHSIDAFIELYELRKRWTLSPYIHDGLITEEVFSDIHIPNHVKLSLIPIIIDLVLSEVPENLSYGLSILKKVIPDDQIYNRPKGFGEKLLKLRNQVEKYCFIANITTTWEALVTKARCLKPTEYDVSYESSPKELAIAPDAYLKHFPLPLPKVEGNELETCPVSNERILDEGNKTCFAGVTCHFEQSAKIRNTKWWVFKCKPKEPNFIWIGYVYVRQDHKKLIEIGSWTSHTHPMSVYEIHKELLEREFSMSGGRM